MIIIILKIIIMLKTLNKTLKITSQQNHKQKKY